MKRVFKCLIAAIMLFAANATFAQNAYDSVHMTRANILLNWGVSGRQVPAQPYDSITWYSYWNLATDGYPSKTYVQNAANPVLSTIKTVLDTAHVGAAGYAQFNLRASISGVLTPFFTSKLFSMQFTAENDTNTAPAGTLMCSVFMDSAVNGVVKSIVRVRVSQQKANGSAAAGTIVWGRFTGQ